MAPSSVRRTRSKVIYRGRVATLSLDTFRMPDGHSLVRETIQHPPSVVILPLFHDGKVLLIRQFRHAVGRVIYEIPAGTSDKGESMLRCAQRELIEETGYAARRWKKICRFYPAPGISTERMDCFVATELYVPKKKLEMDEDEHITVKITTVREALEMVRTNRIIDAKSIIGLLWGLERIRWKNA